MNLHSSPEVEDSADKKMPGNTLIIGSTGVGKTTLEMFMLTLTRKWDPAPRLVLFDLDRGCEIAIRALGGRLTNDACDVSLGDEGMGSCWVEFMAERPFVWNPLKTDRGSV